MKSVTATMLVAAITSCTNTSNPELLVAAGLVAKKALARGLRAKPWVKTLFTPGSRVVTAYLKEAGLHGTPRGAWIRHRCLWVRCVRWKHRAAGSRARGNCRVPGSGLQRGPLG